MSETGPWKESDGRCPKCGLDKQRYRLVEDDEGHEDFECECLECGHHWWEEGADY